MNETAVPEITNSECAREMFMNAARVFVLSFGGENERQPLFRILQNTNHRHVFTTCVNEQVMIRSFTYASYNNDLELLQAFYDIGMDVDAKNQAGHNALRIGCEAGREECVRWLLDHDANVNIRDKHGYTALLFACICEKSVIVELLLQKNAQPNIQNRFGDTALMRASRNGFRDIVQLLLNYNADVDLKDNNGRTALDHAEKEDIKELLLNHMNTNYVLK